MLICRNVIFYENREFLKTMNFLKIFTMWNGDGRNFIGVNFTIKIHFQFIFETRFNKPEVVQLDRKWKIQILYLSMTRGEVDLLMGCGVIGFGAVNVKVIETSINKLSMENQFGWRRKNILIQTL